MLSGISGLDMTAMSYQPLRSDLVHKSSSGSSGRAREARDAECALASVTLKSGVIRPNPQRGRWRAAHSGIVPARQATKIESFISVVVGGCRVVVVEEQQKWSGLAIYKS